MRLTGSYMRTTRLPEVIGRCQADAPSIFAACNSAERRLLMAREAGDEGWHGSFAHMVFQVNQANPYIPCPRSVARIEVVDVCRKNVPINNQFYEFLQFGNGYQKAFKCGGRFSRCNGTQGYDRGGFPTFVDLVPGHIVRVRSVNPLDQTAGKRVLIQGTDNFGNQVYSLDGANNVQGVFLALTSPFVDTPFTFNSITGIQKDVTLGQVQFADVDPATGTETPILSMEPGETVGWYRRYFLNHLPRQCCPASTLTDGAGNPLIQVEAIVKLEHVDLVTDTDYLILQNEEALILEAQSMRYSTMDTPAAKAMAAQSHKEAVGLLQGELAHYLGTQNPAVTVKPFGSATLERQGIGLLI